MSGTKCRILYVDDHEDSSEMVKLLFSESDYEVHTASSMDGALRAIRYARERGVPLVGT